MDGSGQSENGRHKQDQYKAVHTQWMMPQHQMKDHHTIKLMAIISERDNAIHDRNVALSEKKAALAERDMAILQRDAAITERNSAIMERDSAVAALQYARENGMSGNGGPACPPGCTAPRGTKHIHHHHLPHVHPPAPQPSDAPYNHHTRDAHISGALPISPYSDNSLKTRRGKRSRKESKVRSVLSKDVSKSPRKGRRSGGEDLNKQVTVAKSHGEWKGQEAPGDGGEYPNKEVSATKHEWRGQDLGLNQVTFDESTMPAPICSCTGNLRQCYKWGNGGWQSACCTTTLSMYPLPVMPNRRHARIGGRKMSGSAFIKLLSRLAADGHDLSMPLDLKEHWAKHGTNRYITIK